MDRTVLVIGTTGSGKSTFGNFLLGEKKFKVRRGGFSSVTTSTEAHTVRLQDRILYFVDTPGFSDTDRPDEDIIEEIGRAVTLARDGAHAIFICVKAGSRFGKGEQHALEQMAMLGNFWDHAFVVFTNAGEYGETEAEQSDGLQMDLFGAPGELKWLVQQTRNRHILVESINSMGPTYRQKKLEEVAAAIENAFENAGGSLYSNELFRFAQIKYQEIKAKADSKSIGSLTAEADELERERRLLQETQDEVQSEIVGNPKWLDVLLGVGQQVVESVAESVFTKFVTKVASKCSLM